MKKSHQGFTLLELLTTITIAGVLISVAVPAMSGFIQKSKMTTYANELVSAIHIARSEAIKRNVVSCICPTADATIAAPACVASDNWESGWISFTDTDGDCVFNPADNPPDVLLKAVSNEKFTRFTVRNNHDSINNPNFIRFNTRGAPQRSNGAFQQGMFTICDERGYILADGETIPRGVVLSAAGSLRSTRNATVVTACP